jgi:hypothetical protein
MTCPRHHVIWEDGELFCNECGYVEQPADQACLVCHGTGIDDGAESWCECASGERGFAELTDRFFAEVGGRFDQAMRAEREGDFETAKAITESCGVKYQGREV